jgi:hypothetical protein
MGEATLSKVNEKTGTWVVLTKDGDARTMPIRGYPYPDSGFLRAQKADGKGDVAFAMSEIRFWELTEDE